MKRENRSAFHFIFQYTKKYWHLILIGLVTTVIANFFQVIVPLIVGKAIDFISAVSEGTEFVMPSFLTRIIPHDASHSMTLLYMALSIIVVALLFASAQSIARILLVGISRHVDYDMKNDYLEHLQKMPQRFFQENKTGDLMARATNDIPAIRHMTGRGFLNLFNTITLMSFALVYMLKLNVTLTVIALIPFPFIIVVVARQIDRIHHTFERMQEQFSTLMSRVQENFSGIRVIKSYVREKFEISAFERENKDYIKRNMSLAKVDAYLDAWLAILIGMSYIGVLWVGGWKIIHKTATVGELVALLAYVGMIEWPMISVGLLINLWQRGLTAAQRVKSILDAPVPIADTPDTDIAISEIQGDIEFVNVSFKYPGTDEIVLDHISLSIKRGEKLAIIGATGSGKSTIVHLLPRLFDPTEGSILLDGRNIKTIPLKVLRQSIGFVQQESFLFSDTISENISFGVLDAPVDVVTDAADISQLRLDVDQFPDGLDTIIGERGITLSGGQKQRASIARAVIKNPKILILDDSLSAVDTYTEEEILRRIRPMMKERTTIIVAHRISTIRDADFIVVLSDGKIAEQGTHTELLEKQGIYFKMNERQQLEENLQKLE